MSAWLITMQHDYSRNLHWYHAPSTILKDFYFSNYFHPNLEHFRKEEKRIFKKNFSTQAKCATYFGTICLDTLQWLSWVASLQKWKKIKLLHTLEKYLHSYYTKKKKERTKLCTVFKYIVDDLYSNSKLCTKSPNLKRCDKLG